jgi:hypothetical protein
LPTSSAITLRATTWSTMLSSAAWTTPSTTMVDANRDKHLSACKSLEGLGIWIDTEKSVR